MSCFSAQDPYALAEPGRHRTRQTATWITQIASMSAEDERTHRPDESWSSTGERWEHDDCRSGRDDRNDSTHCPDLGQPEMRRHTAAIAGCAVAPRSDCLDGSSSWLMEGSIELSALAASVGNRAPHGAMLARRCPGQRAEPTRFCLRASKEGSGSQAAASASGASNEHRASSSRKGG